MAAPMDDVVLDALSRITECASKPEKFLEVQDDIPQQMLDSTKALYDSMIDLGHATSGDALPSLLVDQFDDEQVWQQLELQNAPCVDALLASIARLSTSQACSFGLSSDDVELDYAASDEEEMNGDGSDAESDDAEDEEPEAEDGEDEEEDEDEDASGEEDEEMPAFPDASDDDESDEEKELKELLEKATSKPEGDEDDESSGSDLDFDFETETVGKSKSEKSKTETDSSSKPASKRKTVVDDKFFSLADMEQFLEQEDRKEERKIRREKGDLDEESTDEEEDEDDEDEEEEDDNAAEEDEARHLMYSDFFDPPNIADEDDKSRHQKGKAAGKKKKVQFVEEEEEDKEEEIEESGSDDDGDDGEEDVEGADGRTPRDLFGGSDSEGEDADTILGRTKNQKSSFQQRQERLKTKISELEDMSLAEKPWQLMGEVTAKVRPENSLLQEDLDFEHTTRLPPMITEETTKSLEDIIKQRIKDKAFDDVERKIKPTEEPYEYKKRIVLDQEKSKQSLSQIYEQEYLAQKQKDDGEKEDPAHEDIKKMMESLFVKLDALSNFHYTPKQTAPEVKVISNQPSIAMEEVAPVSVSDAALLAPEEVKEKAKRLVGETERSDTDKKRARREKKAKQRARQAAKEKREKAVEKLNPGLGNKYAKEKALKELEKQSTGGSKKASKVTVIKESKKKAGLSSTKFFTQLQDEVTTHIQSRKGEKKKKERDSSISSKKYKL